MPIVAKSIRGLLADLPTPPLGKTGWPWTEETDPAIYDTDIAWPKLTIVTPSYNQGHFLEQTIRAVLLQNYPNLEYIIIDGGSNDTSTAIIKKYSRWLSYWQSEKDQGQSQAINWGFSLATGQYYSWVNSDDYYLKDVFHKVVTRFRKKKCQFIYGYAYSFNTKKSEYELITMPPFLDYFIRIPALAQPSCFWSSVIHQPLWEDLQCSLDYELWLRLVKGKSRSLIKEPLSVANVHDNAKTSNPKMRTVWEHDHQLICSDNAHGPVYNWNRLMFFYRIYKRFLTLFKTHNIEKVN